MQQTGKHGKKYFFLHTARGADSHHFNADPDPAFHINADPDPDFAFTNADPDPAPHQSDEECATTGLWTLHSQGLHFEPPGLHCERPRPSTLFFLQLLNFGFNADPYLDPAFHFIANLDPTSKINALTGRDCQAIVVVHTAFLVS